MNTQNKLIINGLIFVIAFLVIMNWSCSKKSPDYNRIPAQEIKIGALISLTGSGSSTGESSSVSLALALRNVQIHLTELGYKVSIQLTARDTQTDTAVA